MDSVFFISIFDSIPLLVIISPILVLSVVSFAIFFERYFFYRAADREIPDENLKKAAFKIRAGDFLEARKIIEESGQRNGRRGSVYFSMLHEILSNWTESEKELLVRTASEKTVSKFEKYAGAVSTIATIAPMLGLFGTVTGMMKSFSALSKLGSSVQSNLAAGITEALVTTALGLLVAIPTVIFYNYLVSKIEKHLRFTEILANGFLESAGGDEK